MALIGCGRIAERHAALLTKEQVPGARLVAVCDAQRDRAAAFGERYHVPFYTDSLDMIRKETIDVLIILTPSGQHAEQVIQLAPYKKHFIVEKPMALTLESADAMIRACDQNGVRLFVVKQNRFNVPVQKLKEAMDAGRLGKLTLGTVRVRWCRTQAYYDSDAWRGTWAYDGGVLANQASHHIDLLEWMMGPVDTVFAKATHALAKIEAEDTAVVVLRFHNGALGVIEATTAARPSDLEGSLSVLGEKGSVVIGGFAVNEMKTWKFVDQKEGEEADVIKRFSVNPPNVYGYGHQAYLKNVVDSIAQKHAALVDGLEGRKSLELITAIYESIETGQEVSLRFRPEKCRLGHR
jgi:predicted dehydrogenase